MQFMKNLWEDAKNSELSPGFVLRGEKKGNFKFTDFLKGFGLTFVP